MVKKYFQGIEGIQTCKYSTFHMIEGLQCYQYNILPILNGFNIDKSMFSDTLKVFKSRIRIGIV